MKKFVLSAGVVLTFCVVGILAAIVSAHPVLQPAPAPAAVHYASKSGDQELAYLLVKLLLRTRATIYEDYTRPQSAAPGVNIVYQRWLAKNAILPASVGDRVFAEVVPGATGGRAWVKMVVKEPRNPHNVGDQTAVEMFEEIQRGAPSAERVTPGAYYYAEPIKSTVVCLRCHGEPRGRPDPIFPQYRTEGWKAGQIVGAAVARVAPRP